LPISLLSYPDEEIIGTSEDDGEGSGFNYDFEEHLLPVTESHLIDMLWRQQRIHHLLM
jgi:hypothetical protein